MSLSLKAFYVVSALHHCLKLCGQPLNPGGEITYIKRQVRMLVGQSDKNPIKETPRSCFVGVA